MRVCVRVSGCAKPRSIWWEFSEARFEKWVRRASLQLYDGVADAASGPAARDDACDVSVSGDKWKKTG